jgi:hypothetical protein
MLKNICLTKMKPPFSKGITILVVASILWSVKTQKILFPDCPDLNAPSCPSQADVVNDASANPLRNPFTPGWAFQASPQVSQSIFDFL